MSFKVGDEVQAKSGGPIMTVYRVDEAAEEAQVYCKWYSNKEDKFNRESFPEAALKFYEGPKV